MGSVLFLCKNVIEVVYMIFVFIRENEEIPEMPKNNDETEIAQEMQIIDEKENCYV